MPPQGVARTWISAGVLDPSEAELEAWARTPGAMHPAEDWDFILATDERAPVFLRLAADRSCANRDAFLRGDPRRG